MKTKIFLSLLCASSTLFAQETDYKSAIFNEDGTVTFQYKNDNAKEVQVDVQFAGKNKMTKNAEGLWTATVGPAAPDMYPYNFVVDGVSIMDPKCEQYFPNEGFKNSLLEIPAKSGSLAHDIKDVPHGSMEYVHYYSKSLKGVNNAVVYLPPKYNANKKYPVFYLISGTTDTEEVYYKVGRVNYILDNLIAEGAAKEMIVVLPYGNPFKLLPAIPGGGMPMTQFGGDVFSNDLVNDLMPYVESHYGTINDRDHRAIGGFSRGGNQGLSNGLRNLDKFSYLCSYSSFTSTDIPGVYDNAEDTNSKIHLFWLGVGTDDFLYGNARDYMEYLDKKGIRSVKEYTHDKFGHTWMNAKYFLDKTLRLLFNPKASEEAMNNGKPALEKTGKEQQFTPGVMARLFPRQIVSPEYVDNDVVFRFKAPEAKNVSLVCELVSKPVAMQRESDGVWSLKLKNIAHRNFKYCFDVDGMKVADPSNMFLSPGKGEKQSMALGTKNAYNLQALGDINYGRINYRYGDNEATYTSANSGKSKPKAITLVMGKDDTLESWFKDGCANLVADKLVADGQCTDCVVLYVVADEAKAKTSLVLRSDDYKTWEQRTNALKKVILN